MTPPQPQPQPASPRRLPIGRAPLVLGLVLVAAAILLLAKLGAGGLWTRGELELLDRALANLGEPRSNLERSPWLPDQLRTWAYAVSGRRDFGLRLPGALAGVGLVGLTLVTARRLGWSLAWAAMAGCFALASPLLLASSRTALGNPTGELWLSAAALALVAAADRGTPSRSARIGLAVVGLASLAAAVASLGIILGGCLPLTLIALAEVGRERGQIQLQIPRAATLTAAGAAALAGFTGLWLSVHQGDGYIPLLGAAKDLALAADPTKWVFTDALEAFGYQLFPFAGLIVVGLVGPTQRARWPSLWLGVALVFTSLWSLRYGATPAPVTIPAALLATAACQRLLDPDEPIALRRMILTCAVLGALVLGKDAGRIPEKIAAPLLDGPVPEFPAAGVVAGFTAHELLPALAKRFALLILIVHVLAPPSADQIAWRARRETPWWLQQWAVVTSVVERLLTHASEESGLTRLRRRGPIVLLFVILAQQSWTYGVVLLGQLDQQMSVAGPLRRFAAAVEAGTLPDPQLGIHRIRDPGLRHYGPEGGHAVFLATRADLDGWLSAPEPRVALVQRRDLPPAATAARMQSRPFHVLDAEHHQYVLVANFLPAGVEDQSPLLGVVVDEPPALAHPTYVAWEPYVELIAWEIEGPVHRGSHATMHMLFRVQRPLPAGTQLYARLQQGKSSRVTPEPRDLTGGVYPPNYWRTGDLIHHRHPVDVPWLEVLPGEHELIVGMRRSEKTNLKITQPAEGTGEHGVTLRGKQHEFAVIGTVELAW